MVYYQRQQSIKLNTEIIEFIKMQGLKPEFMAEFTGIRYELN